MCLVRNSPSSLVKMSLVTAATLKRWRSALHKASMRAVLPDPTGLHTVSILTTNTHVESYPPMPTVKDRSSQSLPSMIGISRPMKLPGPSRISWVCPWSAAACECDGPSCEWLCDIVLAVRRKKQRCCCLQTLMFTEKGSLTWRGSDRNDRNGGVHPCRLHLHNHLFETRASTQLPPPSRSLSFCDTVSA